MIKMKDAFKIKVEEPVDEVLSENHRQDTINRLDAMSLDDIDKYGSEFWDSTNEQINNIYAGQRQFESEVNNPALTALTKFGDKYTKKLTSSANRFMLAARVGKFIGRYEGLETRLNELEDGVLQHAAKLKNMANSLVENHQVLQNQSDEFSKQIAELKAYKEYLENQDKPDEFRLQAVNRKLQKLVGLDGVARTSVAQTKALILQNKQYMYDLQDTVDIVMPVFKMQMIGVMATKYNKESEKLINALKKSGNDLIIMTSEDIAESTKRLIEHGNTQIISEEALIEANKILTQAVDSLNKQAHTLRLESSESMQRLDDQNKQLEKIGNQLDITIAEEDMINNVTT